MNGKSKKYIISISGKNAVGTKRFWLLLAAAEKAAEAFKKGFYLEAIALTESLMATRLEGRLTFVTGEPAEFGTLGPLCEKLLGKDAKKVSGWAAFQAPIRAIRKWAGQRNEALHQMAKLDHEDGHEFNEKYERCRATAVAGFQSLLGYDTVDRADRRKGDKFTATDDKRGGTAFKCLRNIG